MYSMRFRVVAIHHTIRPCTTLVPEVMTVEVGGLGQLDFENSKLSQLRAIIIHVYSTAMLTQAFRKTGFALVSKLSWRLAPMSMHAP